VWATFAVREDLLATVKKGQRIQAEIPALGKTAAFEVFNISALGDFATWRATSEKNSFDLKTFEVKARPSQPLEGLRPGMTVRWRVR
jgi:HlyD family secretion protein